MLPLKPRSYKVVPGRHYGTPTEIWGFRTAAHRGRPLELARAFLRANRSLFKLEGVMPRLRTHHVIESLGACHVILQQRHLGLRIHRAYVTVHFDRMNRIYLAKNRAIPQRLLPSRARFRLSEAAARRRALACLRLRAADARILGVDRLWFPRKDRVRAAFRVRVHRKKPRQEWLVYIDGVRGTILSMRDNLKQAAGTAWVFDPNPVAVLGDWRLLVRNRRVLRPPDEVYARVTLRDLADTGYLDGPRVSTRATPRRVKASNGAFLFRRHQPGFAEAMAYYHLDLSMRYLESLGYRGRRAIFDQPLLVNARGTKEDNAWYSPGLRRLTFGTGGVDDAEDAEVIIHEFGHALQDAICPDFGRSPEASAMGEGFGDYLAASFFAGSKPARLRPAVMSWDGVLSDCVPPCVRRLDEPLTFESFDHAPDADEHENGKIWSATLWDIRRALGRAVADRIVIESHFQLDGFTTLARGARGILDADRNLYRGRHLGMLRRILGARGIGPV